MKVFVAPLDWGLGHATRCVPVIREFLRNGAEVEIAVVPANAAFFREVFPEVRQRIADLRARVGEMAAYIKVDERRKTLTDLEAQQAALAKLNAGKKPAAPTGYTTAEEAPADDNAEA